LATGTVVRSDHPDATLWLHGVVSDDRSEAVYAAVAVAAASTAPHGQVPLPGLDPAQRYRVEPFPPGDVVTGPEYEPSAWWQDGVVLPGAALASAGVQIPAMHPEQLVLIRVAAVGH
jgi:alpha-galactosidase